MPGFVVVSQSLPNDTVWTPRASIIVSITRFGLSYRNNHTIIQIREFRNKSYRRIFRHYAVKSDPKVTTKPKHLRVPKAPNDHECELIQFLMLVEPPSREISTEKKLFASSMLSSWTHAYWGKPQENHVMTTCLKHFLTLIQVS